MQTQIKEYTHIDKLVHVITRGKASEFLFASYWVSILALKHSRSIFSAGGFIFTKHSELTISFFSWLPSCKFLANKDFSSSHHTYTFPSSIFPPTAEKDYSWPKDKRSSPSRCEVFFHLQYPKQAQRRNLPTKEDFLLSFL